MRPAVAFRTPHHHRMTAAHCCMGWSNTKKKAEQENRGSVVSQSHALAGARVHILASSIITKPRQWVGVALVCRLLQQCQLNALPPPSELQTARRLHQTTSSQMYPPTTLTPSCSTGTGEQCMCMHVSSSPPDACEKPVLGHVAGTLHDLTDAFVP
jgi:hypothetical protein